MRVKSTVSRNLSGTVRVPGDKSISHRAVMLSALASGTSTISGLLEGDDVLRTIAAMRQCGATITRHSVGHYSVIGVGGQPHQPNDVMEMGNSGTSTRLLLGLLGGHPLTLTMTGDDSLRRRPMRRVLAPLAQMGVRYLARGNEFLPLTVQGGDLQSITYTLPVASAQVKSAILLAGLTTAGTTTVIEPTPSRDHTEIMLRAMGVPLLSQPLPAGGWQHQVQGGHSLTARPWVVAGDPSSAAFLLAAAALVPNSALTVQGVSLNPLRTGFITTLQEMGASLTITPRPDSDGADGDITISYSALRGVDVPASRAPTMIDEYPIAAVVAACANGQSRFRGLSELRVKESDRLQLIAEGLAACGVTVTIEGDDLIITGTGKPPRGGALIDPKLDHRIAMSFLVLGLVTPEPIAITDASCITTSFPDFIRLLQGLGGHLTPHEVS